MKIKLLILCLIISGFIFLPTTILLIVCMMPTIAAFAVDKSVGKNKTICVAFMNFAGAFPFLMEFWVEFGQQNLENALILIADPQTVIISYLLAAGGYAIDVAVTGIASTIIIDRSKARLKNAQKEKKKLEERWGEEVTGRHRLDDYGFAVKPIPPKKPQDEESPAG